MKEPIDIIIPTLDNLDQLFACMQSMALCRNEYPIRFIIINNGDAMIESMLPEHIRNITLVVTPGENLGWTKALQLGLKHSQSKYVMFANDDIYIPRSSHRWLVNMTRRLDCYVKIGAIGPISNVVMGRQNMFGELPYRDYIVPFLIGFCMLIRREALDKAGGVHDVTFGGDDLDLSIRLRKAGYLLICDAETFVYHHGFQTGRKVFGDETKPNGWNSREMTDNTNMELIRKHGFLELWKILTNRIDEGGPIDEDTEGDVVRKHVKGEIIIEMGCGASKTVIDSIGVDIIPKGEKVPYLGEVMSVADVTADVCEELPFEDEYADTVIARHILEHCLDPVTTLNHWKRIIKKGGRLIISCPDEKVNEGVPLNPQHLHAFTVETMKSLLELMGFKWIGDESFYNNVSFTSVFEKL